MLRVPFPPGRRLRVAVVPPGPRIGKLAGSGGYVALEGLISGPHTLNGSSTTKLKGVIADAFVGTSTLDATLSTTITNLVIPAKTATSAQPWPSSGTIVVESTGTVAGAAIPTIRISMAFSGTSTVNVSRTGPGGTLNCKMDLANVSQACQ